MLKRFSYNCVYNVLLVYIFYARAGVFVWGRVIWPDHSKSFNCWSVCINSQIFIHPSLIPQSVPILKSFAGVFDMLAPGCIGVRFFRKGVNGVGGGLEFIKISYP